jgi:hypothetical protein
MAKDRISGKGGRARKADRPRLIKMCVDVTQEFHRDLATFAKYHRRAMGEVLETNLRRGELHGFSLVTYEPGSRRFGPKPVIAIAAVDDAEEPAGEAVSG